MENWEIIDDRFWIVNPWYEASGKFIDYFPVSFSWNQLRSLTNYKLQHRIIIRKYNKLL